VKCPHTRTIHQATTTDDATWRAAPGVLQPQHKWCMT